MISTGVRGNEDLVATFREPPAPAVDFHGDIKKMGIEASDKDANDLTFEQVAEGDTKDYTLKVTAVTSLDVGSFWRWCWDRAGAEIEIVYAPRGNTIPTADKPHLTFTAKVPTRPTISQQATATKQRAEFELEFRILSAIALDDGGDGGEPPWWSLEDAVIAGWINDPGSQTSTALSATVGSRALALGPGAIDPTTAPYVERSNSGSQATLHLTASPGFTGPYIFGIGNDYGSSTAMIVANKAGGKGLSIHQQATITSPGAYGLDLLQDSAVAAALHGIQSPGTADLVLLQASSGTTEGVEKLVHILGGDGDAAWWDSKTGKLKLVREAEIGMASSAGALHLRGNLVGGSDNTNHVFYMSTGVEYRTWSGSSGVFYPKRVGHNSTELRLEVGASGSLTATPTWLTGVSVREASGAVRLGFYGVTPVARAAAISSPTADAASLKTAVDAIRTALANVGITS